MAPYPLNYIFYVPKDAGLIFYGYTKIRDILSRDFFLQVTEMPRSYFNNIMSFPDIMMCSTGTMLKGTSPLVDVHGNDISFTPISVQNATQQMYRDLCNDHIRLYILSTKNELMNMTQNEDSIFVMTLAPLPNVTEVNSLSHIME